MESKKKIYQKPSIEISMFNGAEIRKFEKSSTITNVIIPEGTVLIGEGAFRGCDQVKSVIICGSVDKIERNAFLACNNLTIYCEAKTKPNGWDSNWNPSECPVYWYSEEEPALNEERTAYDGNFWKYNENGEVIIWKKETV